MPATAGNRAAARGPRRRRPRRLGRRPPARAKTAHPASPRRMNLCGPTISPCRGYFRSSKLLTHFGQLPLTTLPAGAAGAAARGRPADHAGRPQRGGNARSLEARFSGAARFPPSDGPAPSRAQDPIPRPLLRADAPAPLAAWPAPRARGRVRRAAWPAPRARPGRSRLGNPSKRPEFVTTLGQSPRRTRQRGRCRDKLRRSGR